MRARRLLNPETSVLLVVDIQERLLSAMEKDHAKRLVRNTRTLIQAAQALAVPVLISEQYPKGLGPTVDTLREVMPESAVLLEKTAFGCLGDCGIQEHLQALGRSQVAVCGMETHVCVNQTVHQLLQAGYEAHVIEDAVISREKRNYQLGLAKMRQSGAIPSSVETALFEWLGGSTHAQFKTLQALIK